MTLQRTAQEWFQEAVRCYLELHQGCPWCGGSHRVYQLVQEKQEAYLCYGCDFRAGHDKTSGKYFSYPGDNKGEAGKDTMLEC